MRAWDEWREDPLWKNRRSICRDHGEWTDDFGDCPYCLTTTRKRNPVKEFEYDPPKPEFIPDLQTEEDYLKWYQKIKEEGDHV